MPILSFTWTTLALVAGHKTVTWREWKPAYARQFQDKPEGETVVTRPLITAYDKNPRNGGKPVAILCLTEPVRFTKAIALPDAFYVEEGLAFYRDHPEYQPPRMFGEPFDPYLVSWQRFVSFADDPNQEGWVVRFEVVELTPHGKNLRSTIRPEHCRHFPQLRHLRGDERVSRHPRIT